MLETAAFVAKIVQPSGVDDDIMLLDDEIMLLREEEVHQIISTEMSNSVYKKSIAVCI